MAWCEFARERESTRVLGLHPSYRLRGCAREPRRHSARCVSVHPSRRAGTRPVLSSEGRSSTGGGIQFAGSAGNREGSRRVLLSASGKATGRDWIGRVITGDSAPRTCE